MKIELLLHNVTQDQCAPPGEEAFYGWMHGPGSGGRAKLPKYSLRKEPWGSVFVHGPTHSVYLTDEAAYVLLARLEAGETLGDIRSNSVGIESSEINEFENILRGLGIESP
jgi:hypothetical protein